MGGAIAGHLANCGIPSIMLDIVPPDLSDADKGNKKKALQIQEKAVELSAGTEWEAELKARLQAVGAQAEERVEQRTHACAQARVCVGVQHVADHVRAEAARGQPEQAERRGAQVERVAKQLGRMERMRVVVHGRLLLR